MSRKKRTVRAKLIYVSPVYIAALRERWTKLVAGTEKRRLGRFIRKLTKADEAQLKPFRTKVRGETLLKNIGRRTP